MLDQVQIKISLSARERLREIQPRALQESIIRQLYDGSLDNCPPKRLPGWPCPLFFKNIDCYTIIYRHLPEAELRRLGIDFGYYILDIKEISGWTLRGLGG